jgi:DNA-directed RNA polymerase II subunit RPB1
MNMHVPQSISAATELRCLATVLRNIISPRTCSPIIQLFQDTMTGVFRISQPGVVVPESIAMNMLAQIKRPFVRKNREWTGAEVISASFPLMNLKTNITLTNGQLTKGILNKSAFGKASAGLIHVVYNDFGPERAGQLINEIQSIVTQFNLYTGFSVGTSDLIANEETRAFVSEQLRKARDSVSMILSQVHAGQFQNVNGLTDGEELEDKISGALKEVASSINEEAVRSLPPTNRIIQMVNSGSKGGPQNITQMVALLGQQLIEGKRVQYTLQDRTLPHFARYDDGVESRGFVQHSFVDGLMPAEFFFHAQAGREGLIDTAVKTSDTGYIQRRLMKTMEDQHVEYDGTIRNVTGSIVQFRYGEDGVDTVSVEEQACNLATMTLEDVYREFAFTRSDLEPFVSADMSEYPDLVEDILADRDMLVKSVFRYRNNDTLQAPVHLKRLLDKYSNPYSTKTDLTPAHVVGSLGDFVRDFPGNRVFHALLRFYLAPKKSILVHRLTQAMFDELMSDVRFRYVQALVHPGEMVGALAAQSIGEPTTQLTLNTFHSAGTAKANATSGVPRIEELLSASKSPKRPSNVVYIREDLASNQNDAINKVHEIQKTTLRDIVKSVRIYYDPDPSATTVEDDRELLEAYREFSITDPTCDSPWVMRIELNDREMATRHTLDLTEIQTKINELNGVQCIHGNPENTKLVLRMTFAGVTNPLQIRVMEDKVLDTVLTGVDGIGRVHIRTVKNEMFYNQATGGYAPKEQYVLDVEGTNLYDLMRFDGVDGTKTFSNDIHEVLAVFGIEAARLALYEEFNEVFATEKVNYHHLAVLVDSMTFGGRIVPVNRFGMKKNETGVLAKSSFEETSKVMFNAAMWGEVDPMRGVSANIMFGQKPPCGTGFVDILVDETRLPDGVEAEVEEDALERVNQRLESIAPSDCRMEDIMMDW